MTRLSMRMKWGESPTGIRIEKDCGSAKHETIRVTEGSGVLTPEPTFFLQASLRQNVDFDPLVLVIFIVDSYQRQPSGGHRLARCPAVMGRQDLAHMLRRICAASDPQEGSRDDPHHII